jgi:hypothetical protein
MMSLMFVIFGLLAIIRFAVGAAIKNRKPWNTSRALRAARNEAIATSKMVGMTFVAWCIFVVVVMLPVSVILKKLGWLP